MASATLAILITNVKSLIGGRTDKDSVITESINSALRDITMFYDWNELETTDSTKTLSATSYSVALPTTMRKVDGVRLKNASNEYYEVEYVGKSYFTEIYSEVVPSVTGQPSLCYMENRTLYFDKKADVEYTVYIDGYTYITDLTDTGVYPQLLKLRDIIAAQAAAYVFGSLKQLDMANFWFGVAMSKLELRSDEMTIKQVGQLEPY